MDNEGQLFLSVVSVHEIEKGIALLDHKGASARAAGLRIWLTGLIAAFGDNILAADLHASVLAGQLEARAIAAGHSPGMADALIAGIAKANDLVVVTHNAKHFQPFCIDVLSPEETG